MEGEAGVRIAFKGAKTSHVWYVKAIVQKKNNTEGGGAHARTVIVQTDFQECKPKRNAAFGLLKRGGGEGGGERE